MGILRKMNIDASGLRQELPRETAWLLTGPSSIRLINGEIAVNGYVIEEQGRQLTVPTGRSVLIYAISSSAIEATKPLSRVNTNAYKSYYSLAVQSTDYDKTLIIGPTDCGKSTLFSFISNISLVEGKPIILATIDIGQNELYAPGFVTKLEASNGPIIPGSITGNTENCFAGAFSPLHALTKYFGCASKLLTNNRHIVIDTDGWISIWQGIESKTAIAAAIKADNIILMGLHDKVFEYIKSRFTDTNIIRSPCLASSTKKTREERRTHRDRLIARRLLGAKRYSINLDAIPVYGGPLFFESPLSREDYSLLPVKHVVYAEKGPNGVVVVTKHKIQTRLPGIKILHEGWERGLIAAALCNGKEALAVIERIDYTRRRMHILSMCMPEAVLLGSAKVSLESYSGIIS